MSYAELKSRTHFSLLRGASHPGEMLRRAAELKLAALGITDRNGVYGIPRAYSAKQDLPPGSTKLIVGAELTLENLPFVSLLAMNRAGYGLMCRILTASHADKPKGEARLSWTELAALLQSGAEASRGLIVIPDEEIYLDPKHREFLVALRERFVEPEARGYVEPGACGYNDPEARRCEGRLYLPLSRFLDGHDERRTKAALAASRELGLPIIATNDAHYHLPEKRRLQDVLTAIREIKPLSEIGRNVFSNGEHYLKSPAEMAALFQDLPEALENTLRAAERCTFCPSELRYYYPSEWIPQGETAQSYLEKETWKGAQNRYPGGVPADVGKQLEHELELVRELKFADYFLTIWEIVVFARGKGILCQGRGSAANSAVCYCLGITAVDPVRMKLLFERFISAERGEPPDIDVDFEHERREEVIQHIYEKYGRDRAGMVAAVITYRSRSARRQIAKALGLDEETASPEREPLLAEMMEQIHGFPRHLSIHSGGFTLSAVPIVETVPVEPARMEGRTIVQWDKDDLAVLGLLKVDVLSLGMLTAIRKSFDLVNAGNPGAGLELATIPPEDPETYKMIQAADTIGVFQIESRAQMNMLRRLKPENFYDLVIEVAIVRPGPIVGEMVHPYLRRRRGEEPSECDDPRLKEILGRTLGVPLFQEQVMKMAVVMAGFTPGEADELRRAINAWKSNGALDRLGRKLMKGLLASGLSAEFVERIFKQIQGFSEYGFPESHAASFALLAYASSYLKRHHPAELACALINSQPMGFYSNHTLVDDAKRHGVHVWPVHPNLSDYDCTLEQPTPGAAQGAVRPALRLGFRVVNGMGEAAARALVEERRKRPFESLLDFLSRTRLKPRVLNHLAMGGAFECFGHDQRGALWEILAQRLLCLQTGSAARSGGAEEQMNLFESLGQAASAGASPAARADRASSFRALGAYEAIREDFSSYGLSTRGHPMSALRAQLPPALAAMTSAVAMAAPDRKLLRIAGLVIVRQRPATANETIFAALEDETGFMDIVVQKHVQERYGEVFLNENFLVATVRVEREARGDGIGFIAQKFEPLFKVDGDSLRATSRDFR